jgi:hypothetical protein
VYLDWLKRFPKFKFEGSVLLFSITMMPLKLRSYQILKRQRHRLTDLRPPLAALGPNTGSPSRHSIAEVLRNGCKKTRLT